MLWHNRNLTTQYPLTIGAPKILAVDVCFLLFNHQYNNKYFGSKIHKKLKPVAIVEHAQQGLVRYFYLKI